MANDLFDAVTDERIEAAVDRTLCLQAQRGGAPLGPLAWIAVEETFCTCVTGVEDAIEHRLSAIHATLVVDVLRRAEGRLGQLQPTRGSGPVALPSLGRKHG